jgi:cytochrome P450
VSTAADLGSLDLLDPGRYQALGYPHEAWTRLRHEAPVYWYEHEGYAPFWAITKHADIVEISRQPERFIVGKRLLIIPEAAENDSPVRTVAQMDPPEHRVYRKLAMPWFTRAALRSMEPAARAVARRLIDACAREGQPAEFDFVEQLATQYPLKLMAEILGVPEADEPFVLRLTNVTFGFSDDDYHEGRALNETRQVTMAELYEYFTRLAASRREHPTDDLASVLAHAEVNGEPLPDLELISYYIVVGTAGHETTKTTLAGGMLALLEHPAELARLQASPTLIPSAVEEILRWVTPVVHFGRTATDDYQLRGQQIRAGQDVCLFYASANRDEDVFEDPFEFRIDREENPHLSFGVGEHHCMGAQLARLEVRVFLEELLPRLESIELAGPPERLASNFSGGLKRFPVRAVIAPR